MDILYTALKFIVAGSIIVGVTFLAQHADPRYGGLLAAAPITTTLAFLFTYSEAGQVVTEKLVLASFWFVIPTAIFLLVLWLLMNRFGILPGLGGAYTVWIAAVLVMVRVVPGA